MFPVWCNTAAAYCTLRSWVMVIDLGVMLGWCWCNTLRYCTLHKLRFGRRRSQVRFFRSLFPNARVVVQRGCEMDRFAPWNRRFGRDAGGKSTRPVEKISNPNVNNPEIQQQVRQVNVVEAGYLKGGLKRRVIDGLYLQPGALLHHNNQHGFRPVPE